MITQQSLKDIQCHNTISTKGLDILCIAAELDELESSYESANYCTLVENSSNNNVKLANQRNYKKTSKKSVCSFDGCEKNAQYKGLCRGHGKVRFVLLHYVNLCVQQKSRCLIFILTCTNKSYVTQFHRHNTHI